MNLKIRSENAINYLRGIAIFLMLWGHCIQYCNGNQIDFFENIAFKFIYSFHMPLFMLISGYLFFFSVRKRTPDELIIHKASALLYPILMCSLLNCLLTNVVVSVLSGDFRGIIGSVQIHSLWFLWSVLLSSLLLAIAFYLSKNKVIQLMIIALGMCVITVFPNYQLHLFMLPFFMLGYAIAKYRQYFVGKYNAIGICSAVIFAVMLFFYSKKHYIYTTGLWGGETTSDSIMIDLFRWAIGICGSLAISWIGIIIFGRKKSENKIIGCIEALGKNSLQMYALSVSLLSFWLPKIVDRLLTLYPAINISNHTIIYSFVITTAAAVGYCVMLMAIIQLLKECGIHRLIFGR